MSVRAGWRISPEIQNLPAGSFFRFSSVITKTFEVITEGFSLRNVM
jgi:hypothetical protein